MPKELIFTSAPSGIQPGSSGYCTVAKHKDIDRVLTRALEGISFYQMMDMAEKPVVNAYRILSLPTGNFYVLTRICYSGSDHTGRTNYLAHSLVFSKEEIPPGVTPAEIFLRGQGWLSVWPKDAPPSFLSEGSTKVAVPAPSESHATQSTWQKYTGAGSLAHELLPRGRWKFLTQKGTHSETLSILAEAASLPDGPSKLMAWEQVTFTTFLQSGDKADDFLVAAGDESSPALNALQRNALRLPLEPNPQGCFLPFGRLLSAFCHAENKPVVQAQPSVAEVPVVRNAFDAPADEPSTKPHGVDDPFAEENEEAGSMQPAGSNIEVRPYQFSHGQAAQPAGVSGQAQLCPGPTWGPSRLRMKRSQRLCGLFW